MPSISEIITIAKISQYLASNAIRSGGIFGGGVDRLLPRKIYNVRKDVEWMYGIDPTNETLTETSNLLYAICAPFSLEAARIAAISTGGIIVNPSTGQPGNISSISLEFELGVTASPKIVNGINVDLPNNGDNSFTLPLPNIIEGTLMLIISGTPQPTIPVTTSTYTTISYTPTQATITLQPLGTVFQTGQTYILSGLQISS